jgi:hypothetical protein
MTRFYETSFGSTVINLELVRKIIVRRIKRQNDRGTIATFYGPDGDVIGEDERWGKSSEQRFDDLTAPLIPAVAGQEVLLLVPNVLYSVKPTDIIVERYAVVAWRIEQFSNAHPYAVPIVACDVGDDPTFLTRRPDGWYQETGFQGESWETLDAAKASALERAQDIHEQYVSQMKEKNESATGRT